MLKTLKNAFKITEIRHKLLFTLAMLVVIRIGSNMPVPGTDSAFLKDLLDRLTGEASVLINAFSGGSLEQFSILALGISPYITSSIIIQLLTIAIPKLEEMQKDGEDGKKKLAAITRYVTVALAVIQATAMAIGFGSQGLLTNYNALSVIAVVITLTAGSAFLMWVGERITEKGVGNGISIVLVINILATMPADFTGLFNSFVVGKPVATAILNAVIILAILIAMIIFIVLLNDGVRNIPVQYAGKVNGRRGVGGNNSKIPLKINTSGVIPVIFASSILTAPNLIVSFFGIKVAPWVQELLNYSSSQNWFKMENLKYSIGLLVYIVLIIAFAYFYTSVTFNPMMIADNMKRQGGLIPGVRPGRHTSDYLNSVLNKIVLIGAVGLTIVSVVPYIFTGVFNISVSFAGTSLIIVVSVIIETIKQIEAQMLVRNYKGFLNN